LITKELIDRINYFARKSRQEGLTEEEKKLQASARKEYLEAIKARVRNTLEEVKEQEKCSCGSDCKCGQEH